MASDTQLVTFSIDGQYLSFCGADGRLKVWETATGVLKQEYTPSSHLTASCTCLSWMPSCSTSKRRKKKLKSRASDVTQGLNIVAMGTMTGSILLYSVGKGDLESKLSEVHSDAVNCIKWNLENDRMYSCSSDRHIVQWRFSEGVVGSKWKADKHGVHCIDIFPDGQTLLSAGRSIKWWDIETQSVLKKFAGHSSTVLQLKILSLPGEPVEESYFVSAAVGDRLLSAWHLTKNDRSALASFALPDEPVAMDLLTPSSRDQKLLLAVVTKSGMLHIFEHQLNGKRKKPLAPKVNLQLASDINKSFKPLSILACQLSNYPNVMLQIGYGNFMKIMFEKMDYQSCEQNMSLFRKFDVWQTDKSLENTTTKTPLVSSAACVLNPSSMVPIQPTLTSSKNVSKRKLNSSSNQAESSIEDKMKVLQLNLPTRIIGDQPNPDNYTYLLIQGLQSQDEAMLDDVFKCTDQPVILKTIQLLPIDAIIPLINEVRHRLLTKWAQNHYMLHWLRLILSIHTAYLTTCPDLESVVSPLYYLIDARIGVGLCNRLMSLKGRMELLMLQLESNRVPESQQQEMSPLLAYRDDSSDEADSFVDDYILSHSESEPDMRGEYSDEASDMEEDKSE